MGLKKFKKFVARAAVPMALFSFVILVPEARSAAAGKVPICHARGPATDAFVLMEVSASALPAHRQHGDRDPAGGICPGGSRTGTGVVSTGGGSDTGASGDTGGGNSGGTNAGGGQEMVSLCHATGSATNPFVLESVAAPAVQAHLAGGDQRPSNGACLVRGDGGPTAATPEPITMLLFGAGLAGVGYAARRRRRRTQPE